MEKIFGPVPFNLINIEPSKMIEIWTRFNVVSNINFIVNSLFVPCMLSNVIVKPTGVLKLFFDHPNLTWEHENNFTSRPLTNTTKGPEYAGTHYFTNSVQTDMDFRHCLSPYCFSDQVATSCLGSLIKSPWFTFALTEIGGGASSALLNNGVKTSCAST